MDTIKTGTIGTKEDIGTDPLVLTATACLAVALSEGRCCPLLGPTFDVGPYHSLIVNLITTKLSPLPPLGCAIKLIP